MSVSISALIFERLLESIKPIFTDACRNENAQHMVAGIVESSFNFIDPNAKVGKVRKVVTLPTQTFSIADLRKVHASM